EASQDLNPWVRAAAVQGLARATSGRSNLEERLGPFLTDDHSRVREVAALSLLEPEVRDAAGWHWQLNMFQYERNWVNPTEPTSVNEDQLLKVLDSKPAFLNTLREHLLNTNGLVKSAFAVLLAQHGDFDGISKMVAERQRQPSEESRATGALDPLLAGIALS